MLVHIVRPGESLWSIVTGYGLRPTAKAIQKIININNLAGAPYLMPGRSLNIPIEGLYYVVKPGDSLWYISSIFKIPVSTLISYNKLPSSGLIYPGELIRFPKAPQGYLANPGQYLIAVDAGHQRVANMEEEPVGPGSSEMAPKVFQGTQGVVTGKPEYELNLEVAKKVQSLLEQKGFHVLMIRTTNEVNIPNSERAVIANNANADLALHIHADGSSDPSVHGISVLYPPVGTYHVTTQVSQNSKLLAQNLLNELIKSTGANSVGTVANGDITVFQWSTIPTALVEMGFMTNPQEDVRLSEPSYQDKLAYGMVQGIQDYLVEDD